MLSILPDGPELPFATRSENGEVPYHFDTQTEAFVLDWASTLGTPEVVFIDELGKREAQGQGWMSIWPQICASRPKMVVACVREEVLEHVERHLGHRFDVRVHAADPRAESRMEHLFATYADWVHVGRTGLWGGGVEVTLGSALHTFLVPARGLALVSLQAAVLQRGVRRLHQPSRIAWAGWISAGAKALSPAGNRIRPMIAISMQALLFGSAVHVLGVNALGLTLGAFLMGLWAALQGLFLQWVLAGDALFTAYTSAQTLWNTITGWVLPSPAVFVAGWALLWGTLAALSMWVLYRVGTPTAIRRPPRLVEQRPMRWYIQTPSLWLSAGALAGLLLFAGTPLHEVVFVLLRMAVVSMLLGLLVLRFQTQKVLDWARAKGFWGWVVALEGMHTPKAEK